MNRNVEGLLREMIRLKEILERMPNAFHSISPHPSSGDNFVSGDEVSSLCRIPLSTLTSHDFRVNMSPGPLENLELNLLANLLH